MIFNRDDVHGLTHESKQRELTQEENAKVMRQTYNLLGISVIYVGFVAFLVTLTPLASLLNNLGTWGILGIFVFMMIMIHVTDNKADSPTALFWYGIMMTLMGLMGGASVSVYLDLGFGSEVAKAAIATGIIFFGLSTYSLKSGKDFSVIGGFITVGLIVLIGMSLLNLIFFQSTAMVMAVSAAGVLLFSGFILYETSQVLNGHQPNYIRASLALFLTIYNLFFSILRLLAMFNIMSDD